MRIAFDHIHSPYDYDSHTHKMGVCLLTALVALGIDGASGYHVSLAPALGAHWPGVRPRVFLGGSEDLPT